MLEIFSKIMGEEAKNSKVLAPPPTSIFNSQIKFKEALSKSIK